MMMTMMPPEEVQKSEGYSIVSPSFWPLWNLLETLLLLLLSHHARQDNATMPLLLGAAGHEKVKMEGSKVGG